MWVGEQMIRYGQMDRYVNDWDILNLFFPKSRLDSEMIWLLSLYVWDAIHLKGSDVKLEQFFGYLTFKDH